MHCCGPEWILGALTYMYKLLTWLYYMYMCSYRCIQGVAQYHMYHTTSNLTDISNYLDTFSNYYFPLIHRTLKITWVRLSLIVRTVRKYIHNNPVYLQPNSCIGCILMASMPIMCEESLVLIRAKAIINVNNCNFGDRGLEPKWGQKATQIEASLCRVPNASCAST